MTAAGHVLFTVIIPNWNGRHHLQECLESLRVQSFPDFETLLVDNGSSDGSVEYVRQEWPEVEIVALPENIGFAAGVNRGIEASRGKFVVLLNNDTLVDSHWLESLAAAIRQNPDVPIFASKLLNYYDRAIVDSAGDAIDLSLGPYKIGEFQPSERFPERRFIFGACGGGGCYRREIFDRIGFFDEDFFAYFEDVDFSFRANWAGFRTLFVPDAIIYHKVAATSGASSKNRDRFDILRRRNFIFLVIKNYPASFLVRHLPFIVCAHLLKFISYVLQGRWKVAFGTQRAILAGLPAMLRKRRQVMGMRKIANFEMRSFCTSKYGGVSAFLRKKLGTAEV